MTDNRHNEIMAREGKYLYGFIRADGQRNFGPIGIDGGEVYTFPFKKIASVISHLPYMAFDTLPKDTLLKYLTVYQSVLENVLKTHEIIPIKFGTLLDGDWPLQNALEKGYDRILTGLGRMEKRIEIDIVALWTDLDAVLAEIGEEKEIKELKKAASLMSQDERFDLRVKVGKQVKALLDQRTELCKNEIMDAILPYAEAEHLNSLMDDSMILNVALLIQKDQTSALESRVAHLDRQYEDRVNFRIIGPLPPYSFQTLEIKRIDYVRLDEARKALELGTETTVPEIRDAYWRLIKKYHPDKFLGDAKAPEHFERINEAYRLVSDYCKGNACSFRERDAREWMMVQPVEILPKPLTDNR